MTDVYCSTKFKELQVVIQSRLVSNCCKAWPERIDLDWLEKNPGSLFHTPTMISDRQAMLEGKRSRSCEHGCYKHEDKGLVSARARATKEKIIDPFNPLETLQIALSLDCNLTCAYCSSEWSTAWIRDIEKNGEYNIPGYKNKNDNWQKLWTKMKQIERSDETKFLKLLMREISLSPGIKNICILGGEPLIHNGIMEFLQEIDDKKITIISGLGVSYDRFKNVIDKIKDKKNISFHISAETTGPIFEFIRYGSSWKDFLSKIEYLKEKDIPTNFLSTITNLTCFDVVNFYNLFEKNHKITWNPVSDRSFLQPNVLDDLSKKILIDSIDDRMDDNYFSQLKKSVIQPHNDIERKNLSIFLKEFSQRRNLRLDIFPIHFLKWLEIY